jgi:hypothetical protein
LATTSKYPQCHRGITSAEHHWFGRPRDAVKQERREFSSQKGVDADLHREMAASIDDLRHKNQREEQQDDVAS